MRLVSTSDTHGYEPELPDGHILIHCGDISIMAGKQDEFMRGIDWLAKQPHPHKILVPGNHDRWAYDFTADARERCAERGIRLAIDEVLQFDAMQFFCSPWTPNFGKTRAFMHDTGVAEWHWSNRWTRECDVLITHGPPFGILDQCPLPVGCPSLRRAVEKWKPRLHLFGHVHDRSGGQRREHGTQFANVSYMDAYSGVHMPSSNPIFVCDITRLDLEIIS